MATDIAEVLALVADEGSDDSQILGRLEAIAARYSVDEIFAVISRFDTPDILG